MSQCKVYLENFDGKYSAGNEIRGRIECYFEEEKTVRGIKIRLKCEESNAWHGTESYTDPVDHKTKTRYITLTGENQVFFLEQMLFGSSSGTQVLSRGRHVYPFSFRLPYDIPSTYNGPHGGICWKLKAIVDRPMRTDYEDDFIFIVTSPIDFNRLSKDLQEITTYSDEKSVCCWCCQGGNLTMDVELPRIAFVPGETIPFKVHILNMSNSNVENIKVKFKKTITYKVKQPHSESKNDVDEILTFNDHGVGAHGEHTFDMTLAIPNYVEVPNFTKCQLFEVNYTLEVSAQMPSCTLDLEISVWDIQMGHVPYSGRANGGAQIPPPSGLAYPPPPGEPFAPPPGAYPTGGTYPPPAGAYPPPLAGAYPPPPGGAYPPPPGGAYFPPPGGAYPPPTEGAYLPSPGGAYPPPGGSYPPSASPSYPGYPPEKSPSAPSATDDNSKAREAAGMTPSAPYVGAPEAPPPSYSEIQQQNPNVPYPPK